MRKPHQIVSDLDKFQEEEKAFEDRYEQSKKELRPETDNYKGGATPIPGVNDEHTINSIKKY